MAFVDAVLADIRTEARSLDPLKVLLTVLAAPFFVVGFVAAWVFRAAFFVGAWGWSAALVGWRRANRDEVSP